MAFMTWDEIRAATGGRLLLGKMRGNDAFAGITTDTRKVQAGDLFVAGRSSTVRILRPAHSARGLLP